MKPIVRNLKSVSGSILAFTVLLIVTLWLWNFLQSHNVPGAGWVSGRLSGAPNVAGPMVPAATNIQSNYVASNYNAF